MREVYLSFDKLHVEFTSNAAAEYVHRVDGMSNYHITPITFAIMMRT
jgi:hypothetical protein